MFVTLVHTTSFRDEFQPCSGGIFVRGMSVSYILKVIYACNLNHQKPEDNHLEVCGNCPIAYLKLQETSITLLTFSVDPRLDKGKKRTLQRKPSRSYGNTNILS